MEGKEVINLTTKETNPQERTPAKKPEASAKRE